MATAAEIRTAQNTVRDFLALVPQIRAELNSAGRTLVGNMLARGAQGSLDYGSGSLINDIQVSLDSINAKFHQAQDDHKAVLEDANRNNLPLRTIAGFALGLLPGLGRFAEVFTGEMEILGDTLKKVITSALDQVSAHIFEWSSLVEQPELTTDGSMGSEFQLQGMNNVEKLERCAALTYGYSTQMEEFANDLESLQTRMAGFFPSGAAFNRADRSGRNFTVWPESWDQIVRGLRAAADRWPTLVNQMRSLIARTRQIRDSLRSCDSNWTHFELERFIWINWMAAQDGDAGALDRDPIENRLTARRLIGPSSTLAVDFGSYTSVFNTIQARDAARGWVEPVRRALLEYRPLKLPTGYSAVESTL